MTEEERVKLQLGERFPYMKDSVAVSRARRVFADVPLEKFAEVFSFLVKDAGFGALSTITGVDNGDSFCILYHLNRQGTVVLTLRVSVAKENARVNTLTPVFANAEIYEREIIDLLGVQVDGLPPGNRYPLPDGWPQNEHPLRKDWKPEREQGGGQK